MPTIGHFVVVFLIGCLIGLLVALITIAFIRKLEQKTRHYLPTYMPMTIVESDLIKYSRILYPLVFGFGLTLGYAIKTIFNW